MHFIIDMFNCHSLFMGRHHHNVHSDTKYRGIKNKTQNLKKEQEKREEVPDWTVSILVKGLQNTS